MNKNKIKKIILYLLLISALLMFIAKSFIMGFIYFSLYLIGVFAYNNNVFEKVKEKGGKNGK